MSSDDKDCVLETIVLSENNTFKKVLSAISFRKNSAVKYEYFIHIALKYKEDGLEKHTNKVVVFGPEEFTELVPKINERKPFVFNTIRLKIEFNKSNDKAYLFNLKTAKKDGKEGNIDLTNKEIQIIEDNYIDFLYRMDCKIDSINNPKNM